LASGCWFLVAGCWFLVAGCCQLNVIFSVDFQSNLKRVTWSLVSGCWLLVAGCWLSGKPQGLVIPAGTAV